MKCSASLGSFGVAMAAAQSEMTGAVKDANNEAFKTSGKPNGASYADLAAIVGAIRSTLTKHGISYMQMVVPTETEAVGVETMLLHSSGEYIVSDPCFIPVTKANAHGYGSALTYARRYSLASICGLEQKDDDGNAAAAAAPTVKKKEPEVAVKKNMELQLRISTATTRKALEALYVEASKAEKMAHADEFARRMDEIEALVQA